MTDAHPQYAVDWTDADDAAAEAEGWGIYDFGRGLEIERIDDTERFDSDAAALAHVVAQAASGSAVHSRALAIHHRYESVLRS